MNARFFLALTALVCFPVSCAVAPAPGWVETRVARGGKEKLFYKLVMLLPKQEQTDPAAQQEALELSERAYKAAASIARVNKPKLTSWFNNMLVNSRYNLCERGLCWHYQHDLYRELRRMHLHYYRLGCCLLDEGEMSEHHLVYISAKGKSYPDAVVLDAWRNSGRLKIIDKGTQQRRECKDEPNTAYFLNATYPEGHSYPIEHWAKVKGGNGMKDYLYSNTPEGRASRQGQLMEKAMQDGLHRRGGRPTDY